MPMSKTEREWLQQRYSELADKAAIENISLTKPRPVPEQRARLAELEITKARRDELKAILFHFGFGVPPISQEACLKIDRIADAEE